MAILTTTGRAAIASAVKAQPLHLAWGAGDPAWDSSPVVEPVGSSGLVAEVGRRGGALVSFVMPDPAGDIETSPQTDTAPAVRWSISGTPTPHLHIRFNFSSADGPTEVIREVGVFVGTVIKPAVMQSTPGKLYFLPTDIQTAGMLLLLQRGPKIIRSNATRQSFEFVQTF